MARSRSRRSPGSSTENLAQAMRDSAQKIWLAGLGAYERAKAEGPKMFETLVAQGQGLRARATDAADQALKAVREQAGEAQGRWDKLEQVFEDRVSRSLNRLGVVTNRELAELSRQVEELNGMVSGLMRAVAGTKGGKARPARRPGAKKAKAKRASRASRARRA
jgi:poly(hydroxyalkanoate) granule-associated protein